MAIYENSIPVGAQVPTAGDNIGGGLIAAVYMGAGGDGTTYDIEYSPDSGTTWDPVTDEAGTAIQITYVSGGAMHQINPPIRAPFVRINSDTNEADAALEYELHTV